MSREQPEFLIYIEPTPLDSSKEAFRLAEVRLKYAEQKLHTRPSFDPHRFPKPFVGNISTTSECPIDCARQRERKTRIKS